MIQFCSHLTIVLALALISACTNLKVVGEIGSTNMKQNKVLVVNSNSAISRYTHAQHGFIQAFGDRVEVIDLHNDSEPVETLLDVLSEQDFSAIYTVGGKALSVVDYISPSKPVVFSSVLNWRRFDLQENYYGVANQIPLAAQLGWFKYVFPELDSLAVIYSNKNKALIQEAETVATRLGIELIAAYVESSEAIAAEMEQLSTRTKHIWLISDSAVLSSAESAKQYFNLAQSFGLSVFSYDELFVDLGALMVVDTDQSTTGRQAALILRKVMENARSQKVIHYPAGSSIVLNRDALEHGKLDLNEKALESIGEIR